MQPNSTSKIEEKLKILNSDKKIKLQHNSKSKIVTKLKYFSWDKTKKIQPLKSQKLNLFYKTQLLKFLQVKNSNSDKTNELKIEQKCISAKLKKNHLGKTT